MENFGIFVIFGVNLSFFFHLENSNYLFGTATGQRTSTMLIVFNILIHEFYREFDKNCIKFENWEMFGFLSFLGPFLSKKPHLSLHKRLLDNEFVSC